MTLMPYDPFKQMANIRKEFDNLFSDYPSFFHTAQNWGMIRADVHETSDEIIVSCDIPGLESKEDVDIDIDHDTLNVSGSIKKTNEVNDENMHRKERFTGRFHRSITLPSPVSHDGVKATYKNGVLEVRMPKVTTDERKKINVEFH
ncbi:MAG TPA: Hsp20/alpha crystallin family protein [Bacillota bacterium]|nr:Hsp20/alpha crystallin family protein [Bacillota bacterium]